jgi:hypothetical protein
VKKCTDCKYCIKQDTGYSNYTVTGMNIDCLLSLNPDLPTDEWYREAKELDFAEKCAKFTEGEPVFIDVDHDEGVLENYSNDEEIKELLRNY